MWHIGAVSQQKAKSPDTSLHYQQVRRVLDQIRGRSYEESLMILEYTPYRACESIIKLLVSVRCIASAVWQMQFC